MWTVACVLLCASALNAQDSEAEVCPLDENHSLGPESRR